MLGEQPSMAGDARVHVHGGAEEETWPLLRNSLTQRASGNFDGLRTPVTWMDLPGVVNELDGRTDTRHRRPSANQSDVSGDSSSSSSSTPIDDETFSETSSFALVDADLLATTGFDDLTEGRSDGEVGAHVGYAQSDSTSFRLVDNTDRFSDFEYVLYNSDPSSDHDNSTRGSNSGAVGSARDSSRVGLDVIGSVDFNPYDLDDDCATDEDEPLPSYSPADSDDSYTPWVSVASLSNLTTAMSADSFRLASVFKHCFREQLAKLQADALDVNGEPDFHVQETADDFHECRDSFYSIEDDGAKNRSGSESRSINTGYSTLTAYLGETPDHEEEDGDEGLDNSGGSDNSGTRCLWVAEENRYFVERKRERERRRRRRMRNVLAMLCDMELIEEAISKLSCIEPVGR
ncbi:hypothetical protein HK102_010009 [Quaeritorhiza haematococci]|nr:hypothetical protein HK102_010009 [Quaeritorhiza haematococci]